MKEPKLMSFDMDTETKINWWGYPILYVTHIRCNVEGKTYVARLNSYVEPHRVDLISIAVSRLLYRLSDPFIRCMYETRADAGLGIDETGAIVIDITT